MTTQTSPRHLVRLHDLNAEELNDLLDLSARLRARAGRGDQRPLEGRTVGLLFFRGSLRTRVSLEAAVHALGGFPINLTATSDFWELEHQVGAVMDGRAPEHIQDAAAAISLYVDALAIRTSLEGKAWSSERRDRSINAWAEHATVPVINMESALWHPLQALADLLTMRDQFGQLGSRRIAIQWVHSPAPTTLGPVHSLVASAMRLGMDISIGHPPGFDLDEEVLEEAREAGSAAGGRLRVCHDPVENVEGASIVYARSWRSLETWDNPTLAASRLARHEDWCITEELLEGSNDAKLMHAMPVRRNVEATDEVLDGPRSLLLAQAANRLHSQKALMTRILRR
ncbi:MAG: N-acetylornithine carbamoyltransferase [Planctomycetota bacterium]|nr:N-acetylornithine carbamoyltransferase [Planctomycetota bacterium]